MSDVFNFLFAVVSSQSLFVVFQKQLSDGKFALLSCEELLEFANQTLTITSEEEFLKVGWEEEIKSLKKHCEIIWKFFFPHELKQL